MDSVSLYISVTLLYFYLHCNNLNHHSLLPDSIQWLFKNLLPGNMQWRLFTAVQSAVNNSVLLYKLLSVSITLINEPAVATRPEPTRPEYQVEKGRDTRRFEHLSLGATFEK